MNEFIVSEFFLYCLLLLFVERKWNVNIPLVFICVPFLILVSFSYTLDTDAYVEFLREVDIQLFNYHGTEFAPGFQILTKIIKLFVSINYPLYLFILSSINLFLILRIIQLVIRGLCMAESKLRKMRYDIILALIMYFCYFGLYYNSITLRANFALSLIYLIMTMFIDKKINPWKIAWAITLMFCATMFHSTAVIGILPILVFYFSRQYSVKKYLIINAIAGFVVFGGLSQRFVYFFLDLNLLDRLLELLNIDGLTEIIRYSTLVEINDNIPFKFIFQYILSLVFLYSKNQPLLYYRFLNVYYVGILIGAMFGAMGTITRVQDFFTFSCFILSWLYIRNLKSTVWILVTSLLIIPPQLFFVLRIINGY
jgi:hypothetical protein